MYVLLIDSCCLHASCRCRCYWHMQLDIDKRLAGTMRSSLDPLKRLFNAAVFAPSEGEMRVAWDRVMEVSAALCHGRSTNTFNAFDTYHSRNP
jgi:hypothetical protein